MKKIFALFTVLTMAFTLAACGDKTSGDRAAIPPPAGAQQSEGAGGDGGSGSKQDLAKGVNTTWPSASYITPGMKYTGRGEIVLVNQTENDETRVYVYGADIEDAKDYIAALKKDGFTWYSQTGEPEPDIAYDDYGTFTWEGEADGGSRFIDVTCTEDQEDSEEKMPNALAIYITNANPYDED